MIIAAVIKNWKRHEREPMNKEELIEQLSDKEHASWSHWMEYLFNVSMRPGDGTVVIPRYYVERWTHQVNTAYEELSEKEKQSDRNEVAHILPIIEAYHTAPLQQIITLAETALNESVVATESDWPNILANGLEAVVTLCKEQLKGQTDDA